MSVSFTTHNVEKGNYFREINMGAPWSQKEHEKLMQMSKKGYSIEEIADLLGRSYNSVKLRLYGNGTKFRKENMS